MRVLSKARQQLTYLCHAGLKRYCHKPLRKMKVRNVSVQSQKAQDKIPTDQKRHWQNKKKIITDDKMKDAEP